MCNLISNFSKQILFFSAVVLSIVFFYPQIVFAGGGGNGGGDGSGATAQEAIDNARTSGGRQRDGVLVERNDDGTYTARNTFDGGDNGGPGPAPGPAPGPGPTWTPPAPAVSLVAELNNDAYTEDISVLPVDIVDIQWDSPNATTCEGQRALSGQVNSTSGQFPVDLSEFEAGETRLYEVRCRNSSGGRNSAWRTQTIAVTLLGLGIDMSLDRSIIRVGDRVTLFWDVAIDGSATAHEGVVVHPDLRCDLAGAIRQEIDIQANPNGSATSDPIFNFFNNRLRCVYPDSVHEFSVTTPLEVIPAPRER